MTTDRVQQQPKPETQLVTIKPALSQDDLLRQTELGLMFAHSLVSQDSRQVLKTAAAVFALADLMVEKGLIEEDQLRMRRKLVTNVLMESEWRGELGLFVNESDINKYEMTDLPQIDCESRLSSCHAACCRLGFPLSRQDVEEGAIRWDFGRPYWNLRNGDGYCVHNDANELGCKVYGKRPGPCRSYDCRKDPRIWADFDARVLNPDLAGTLAEMGAPHV